VLEGAGEIVFTAYIADSSAPEGATETSAYTYTQFEDTTANGTAWTRTYYLPHRRVEIRMQPYGIGLHDYLQERERIFGSFRWKPGAESNAVNVDGPGIRPGNIKPPNARGLGE
jgi:hypothetical protein